MKRSHRPRFLVSLLFWLLVGLSAGFGADSSFALRDGDTVVFYGDESTAVQFYDDPLEPRNYTTFIETYAITRFPEMRLNFVNSGWNGDRVSGGAGGPIDVRIERDVIRYKPSVLMIMLGMNDAWMTTFDAKRFEAFTTGYEHQPHPEMGIFDAARFAAFTTGYQRLIETIKNRVPGIRLTLLKPLVYEAPLRPMLAESRSSVLLRYGQWLDDAGERDHLTIADANSAIAGALEQAKVGQPNLVRQILSDDMHPGPAGHLLIAAAALKTWHAPALVSRVEIDAGKGTLLRAENTMVRAIRRGRGLSWSERDQALPSLPEMEDPDLSDVSRFADVVALDEQMLKITGLLAIDYQLRIDGESIGSFSSQQLKDGINLALLDTPMRRQATRVFKLVQERENVHFGRWKRLEFPLQDIQLAHKQEALNAFDALERDLIEEQYRAAKPLPHHYDLIPIRN